MKISNFKLEVMPCRGLWGLGHMQELRFRIDDAEGHIREYRQVLTPDHIPDEQSLLDYIFDRAKDELKKRIVSKEETERP